MARPQIQIDQTEFEKLCGLQCAETEIADWFNCSVDTIDRWCVRTYGHGFAETFEQKRGRGKIALRRAQFELAKKSAAMAIFLGKNYLGQTDRHDVIATSGGKIDELIEGLKEPTRYDIHSETTSGNGAMEDE